MLKIYLFGMFVYFSFVKLGFCMLIPGQIQSRSKRRKRIRLKVSRRINRMLFNRHGLIMWVRSIMLCMGWLIRALVRISKNIVRRDWDSITKVKYKCATSSSKTTTTPHTTHRHPPHNTSKPSQNSSNHAPKTPNLPTRQKDPRMRTNFSSS